MKLIRKDDGTEIKRGDQIESFRGEMWTFDSVVNANKVSVDWPGRPGSYRTFFVQVFPGVEVNG